MLKTARFRLLVALGALLPAAACAPTYKADPRTHSGRQGWAGAVALDSDRASVSGGQIETFGDFHGFALFTHLDYQRLRRSIPEQGTVSSDSAAWGLGLRLSPLGLLTRGDRHHVLRFIDLYGEGGTAIGFAGKSGGGITGRQELFAGGGLDLRAGFGRATWFPALSIRYRHTARGLDHDDADLVLIGFIWMTSYSADFGYSHAGPH